MRTPSTAALAFGCALLAAMVLSPTVFGDWVWDDFQLIVYNPHVADFDVEHALTRHFWDVPLGGASGASYYRPISTLGHLLAWAAGGGEPLTFHLLSLLLHAACTALTVTWLVRRVDEARSVTTRVAVACATLVFALHPARVQSIAWISGSTDLWATLFVLIGMNVVVRGRGVRRMALAGTAFALGMFAKEVAFFAPLLVFIDQRLGVGPRLERREIAALAAPMIVPLVARTAVVGASSAGTLGSLAELPLHAAYTLGAYVMNAVVPLSPTVQVNLAWSTIWASEPDAPLLVALGVATIVVILALFGILYRKESMRPWLADLAWVVVPLLPVLNLLSLGSGVIVASRLLYVPLVGATLLFARLLAALFATRHRALGLAGAGLLIIASAVGSTAEIAHWQNDVSLARHWREQRPNDPMVLDNLARVLLRMGEIREAYQVMSDRLDEEDPSYARRYAAVTWAYMRLALTSDVDQPALLRLRAFFDAIAEHGSGTLPLPERTLHVELTEAQRLDVMTNSTYGDFHDAWANAHARTLDVRGALRIVEHAPELAKDTHYGQLLHARALGWNERWDDALAVVAVARERFGGASWGPVESSLRAGQRLAAEPPPDPIDAVVGKSRVMSDLGLPALGRALLAPLEGMRDIRVVHARVQAHIADQRYDLALAELDRASETMPEAAGELRAARAEVEAMARSAPRRRDPPPWQ